MRRAGRIVGSILGEDEKRYEILYRRGDAVTVRSPSGEEYDANLGVANTLAEAVEMALAAWGKDLELSLHV